jgi:TRAP-type C4-dicarboxylate transport system permease small subunit
MLFLVVMTALIGIQVASRNMFNIGLPWADELARFAGLATVFFTIPLLQYQGRHIAVDIFSSRLRGRVAILLGVVNEAVVLLFCLLFLASFTSFFQRAAHFATPAIGMPNWLFYTPAVIGIIMCTLVTGLRLARLISTGHAGAQPSEKDERGAK